MKFTRFDISEYLDNEEVIAEFLVASMELDDPDVFLSALATVAKARGMTQLAKDSGLSRKDLYKSLEPGSQPPFDTIMKITRALGVPMTPQPVSTERRHVA